MDVFNFLARIMGESLTPGAPISETSRDISSVSKPSVLIVGLTFNMTPVLRYWILLTTLVSEVDVGGGRRDL